jgi:hypothetical protein
VATSNCQFTPNCHTGGHVTPAWNLRRWPARSDTWQASITTWLEAGEQMSNLASAKCSPDQRGTARPVGWALVTFKARSTST